MFRTAANVLLLSVALAHAGCSQSSGERAADSNANVENAPPPSGDGTSPANEGAANAPSSGANGAPRGSDPASQDQAGQGNGATPIASTPSGAATQGASNGGADPGADPGSAGAATCNLEGAASAQTPTIWVIGDSTASIYASNLYPRMGWAQPLQDYFANACATIQDRAISGRSSKSFFDEGAWTPVRDALKAGDVVLIQFGHNDEKSEDPLRFTDPFTTFQQYLSTYIDEAQARGATPILLTPINRNNWSGAMLSDTHGQYPEAMRQLATARGVPLVDATLLTKTYFERIGQAATTQLFLVLAPGQFPNYPDGNTDNTHLQETGARTIAQIFLADFARQGLPVGRLVKSAPVAP